MKRLNKLLLLIIILSGIFLLAVGCKKFNLEFFDSQDGDTSSVITDTDSDDKDNTEIDSEDTSASDSTEASNKNIEITATEDNATPTPAGIQPTANIDLPVYTVDAEKGEIIPVTAVIPEGEELTPELIVDKVIESLADQSIVIDIKNVTVNGDTIIVNFGKENTPYKNMGSGYEAAILDAIAQSLIDNLEEYNSVIYRVDDAEYASGAFEFGIDEVYFKR